MISSARPSSSTTRLWPFATARSIAVWLRTVMLMSALSASNQRCMSALYVKQSTRTGKFRCLARTERRARAIVRTRRVRTCVTVALSQFGRSPAQPHGAVMSFRSCTYATIRRWKVATAACASITPRWMSRRNLPCHDTIADPSTSTYVALTLQSSMSSNWQTVGWLYVAAQ